MEPLPTPRQFLEILISSLPNSSTSEADQTSQGPSPKNPLESLDQARRNLLITLHVLYPSILLHSLDLLDRGLVTKITQTEDAPSAPSEFQSKQEGRHHQPTREGTKPPKNTIYQVRSAQTSSRGRPSTSKAVPKIYTVHLKAWNCSCAAFAFSAYPPASSILFSQGNDVLGQEMRDGKVGGMSSDGMVLGDGKDGGVAVCKHLLASLLVERCSSLLGGYLRKRSVSRLEMAGLGADV